MLFMFDIIYEDPETRALWKNHDIVGFGCCRHTIKKVNIPCLIMFRIDEDVIKYGSKLDLVVG